MMTRAKVIRLFIVVAIFLTGLQIATLIRRKTSKHIASFKGREIVRTLYFTVNSKKAIYTGNETVDLVPNIVHYIWVDLNDTYKFTFLQAVSFISVHKFWRPEEILVHVNNDNHPKGPWWDYVTSKVSTKIRFLSYNMSQVKIFGERPRYVEHISDIMRILQLKEYGGIYIDSDVIALRSLEPLRHYHHTQGVGLSGAGLSNGVIIAKKTSPFLNIWLEEYKKYGREKVNNMWGHYSITRPRQLLEANPSLVRIERDTLVRPVVEKYTDLNTRQNVWKHSYSIHVWRRFMYVPDKLEDIKLISNKSLLRDVMEYVIYDKIPYYALGNNTFNNGNTTFTNPQLVQG